MTSMSSADKSERPQRLAAALRQLIAAVKHEENSAPAPQLTSEWLANSYYEQSRANRDTSLSQALHSARQAAANSPQFGFTWERVAELEFSFGHSGAASVALEKSLALSPRNAQALALKGFLLAAQGKTREALGWFDQALAVDSALGNAWLGHGLCRIRLGDDEGGRQDLMIAAALEPQRAELRSYLGKAYGNVGDFPHATRELGLAEKLDPQDPTAWLYSALLNQENNRVNESIRDLEKSEQLNDNRSVYRSKLLLDQDQAVRSANLAGMYSDAGMPEVAEREAARAVNYDYADYSAHLFLANSYNLLSDPGLVNLRYETASENEFLLANLLAPVSAGTLSPDISQNEYSRLFEQNRAGVVSDTEYLSRGAWSESGSQYGIFDNFSYSFGGFYNFDPGQRPNEDIEEQRITLNLKAQLTPQDNIFFLMQYYKANGGDLAQYYNQNTASPSFRYDERQEPTLGIGYHHEWAPGVHTLVFGARLVDNTSFTNGTQPSIVTAMPDGPGGVPTLIGVQSFTAQEIFQSRLEIYSGEVQQIFEQPNHNTIMGARAQYGHIQTENIQGQTLLPDIFDPFHTGQIAAQQNITSLFKRFSVYGYHQWEVTDWLELVGGGTYDRITFPENFRMAPISGKEETVNDVSPKAGMILRPLPDTTIRFAYTRSLGGASIDQSYQLEPSQVAGFIQSFRSIIPESIAGANVGAKFETYGLSLEQKFHSGTYLGVTGELLNSKVNRLDGAFDYLPDEFDFPIPSGLRETLNYREPSLLFTANQLVGRDWSFGLRYKVSEAVLDDNFPSVANGLVFTDFQPRQRVQATLNQLNLFGIFNHPCGFFAEGEAVWYSQDNIGYQGTEPGDDFWQLNAFAGYRFPRRHAEVTLGVLNLTDQNYQLNPLNLYNELPRERTLMVQFRVNF
jgi:Tfp pilus assembly protein PilF